ncbi:MAG: RDD family protein [Frankiales bacterium]|nr:RDD family protein [Frankiales bacterium]
MSEAQLVTGEAVALDLQPAALPSRVVAGLIDASLQLVVLLVVGGIVTATSLDVSEAAAQALSILLLIVTFIVYPVTFETLLRGRTPGKAAMGLRVVRDDGGPIAFRQALVRGLSGAFLERPGITVFVAGIVSSLLNPQGKRLGDLMAGTVVLRERVPVRGGAVAQMPPQLAGWAAGLDLSGLGNELALSVRQFVSRSDQLTTASRDQLGGQLVAAVTAAVGPAPAGAPGWAVLSAVLAERRRRESERLAGPVAAYAPRSAPLPRTEPSPAAEPEASPQAGPGGFAPPG